METCMLHFEELKASLNQGDVKYSDSEIEEIRISLYQLSLILYKLYEQEQQNAE